MTRASKLLHALFALAWASTAVRLAIGWMNGTPPDGLTVVVAVAATLTLAWDRLGVAVSNKANPSA